MDRNIDINEEIRMTDKKLLAVGLIFVLIEVRDFHETGIKIHQGTWQTLQSVCPESFHPANYQRQDHRMLVDSVMTENDIESVWMPYRRVTLSRWAWANGTPAASSAVPESSTNNFGCGYVSFRVAPRDSAECSTSGYGFICQGAGKEICSNPGLGYGDCLNISDRWLVYGCGVNNWFEASYRCQSLGAELATIVSEANVDRMKKSWFTDQRKPCDSVWIGLHREKWESPLKNESTYGSEASSVHLFWGIGEPNPQHNCSILKKDTAGRLYLRSAECTAQHHILCVRDDAETSVTETKTGSSLGPCPGCTGWTVVFGVLFIVCLLLLGLVVYLCKRVRRHKSSDPEKPKGEKKLLEKDPEKSGEEAQHLLDETSEKSFVAGERNKGDVERPDEDSQAKNQTQVVTSPLETHVETNKAADACLSDATPSESQATSASCLETSNELTNFGNSESNAAKDPAAGCPVTSSDQKEPPENMEPHTPQKDQGPSESLNQHLTQDAQTLPHITQGDPGKETTSENTQLTRKSLKWRAAEPLVPVVFSKTHNEKKVQIRVYIIDSKHDYREIIQKIDIKEPWEQQQSDTQILWQNESEDLVTKLEALHGWKVSPDITDIREIGQILWSFSATHPFHLVCSRLLTLDGQPADLDIVFTFSVGGKDHIEVIPIFQYDGKCYKDSDGSESGGEGFAAENLVQSGVIKGPLDSRLQQSYQEEAIDLKDSKSGDFGDIQKRSEPGLNGATVLGARAEPRASNPENQHMMTSDPSTSTSAVCSKNETSDKVPESVEPAVEHIVSLAAPLSETNQANTEASAEEAENKENWNKESLLGEQNMKGKTE